MINLNEFSNSTGRVHLDYKSIYAHVAKENKVAQLTSIDEKKIRKIVQKAEKDSLPINADFLKILIKSGFFTDNKENPKMKNYLQKFPLLTAKKKALAKKKAPANLDTAK